LPGPKVVGELEALDGLLEEFIRQIVLRDDVIVDMHVEMPPRRLAVD
jgi:hypothetical protein